MNRNSYFAWNGFNVKHVDEARKIMASKFKIEIIYLKQPGSNFDWDHYLAVHSPMALRATAQCTKFSHYDVAKPVDDASSPIHCVSTLFFDTKEDMEKLIAAFVSPAFEKVVADQANFTNVDPQLVPSDHYEWSDSETRIR